MSAFTTYQEASAATTGHGPIQYQYEYPGEGQASGSRSQSTANTNTNAVASSSQSTQTRPQAPANQSQNPQKTKPKRRKVNHACLYCRRSHMTCDEGRPCQRCIKREIGHLCHDEPRTQGQGQHGSQGHQVGQGQAQAQVRADGQAPENTISWGAGPSTSSVPPTGLGNSGVRSESLGHPQQTPTPTTPPIYQRQQWVPPYRPGTFGTEFAVLTEFLETIDRDMGLNGTIVPSETQGQTQTSQGSFYSTSAYSELSQSQPFFTQSQLQSQPHRPPLQTQRSPPRTLTSTFPVQNQYPPSINANVTRAIKNSGTRAATSPLASGSSSAESPSSTSQSAPTPDSERHFKAAQKQTLTPNPNSLPTPSSLRDPSPNLPVLTSSLATDANGNSDGRESAVSPTQTTLPSISSILPPSSLTSPLPSQSSNSPTLPSISTISPRQAPASASTPTSVSASVSTPSITAIPNLISNISASSINRFLLTAADQESGSREDRLARVIRSKYEAGLLKPYNYVKGYARLSRWMEGNVSQESKQRVLMPLSVLRPKFRAIAQSLRPLDLVFIEEAFERLLLDYDRVFASMGVPACLWRRTGEIYKGNREFSELIGVDGYLLREGRVCIYELMAEESAVNYWEKYGTVAFDSSQKAVLTSCVLRYKPKLESFASFASRNGGSGINARNQDKYTTPNTYGAYSTYPAPMMPPTTVLARTGMTTKLWASASASQHSYSPHESGTNALPADEAAGAPPSAREHRGGPVPTEEGLISCCFSFTIRRDKWGIPSMIVGNFVRC
ncbi:Transcription factor [Stygiomarasmius scandens]|uniref:Transcription factor n=1 Tax=Marasmiellus scandens TaxID=2682957 RepID=A0ABR1J8S1_9AGAR